MFSSKVISTLVGKFRGGSKDSLLIKMQSLSTTILGKAAFGPGIEINPSDKERTIRINVNGSDSYIVCIGGTSDNVTPDTSPGERRFFSVDADGNLSSYIKIKNNETIELNGNSDFAVLYSKLQTQFDELNTKYNALVTAYNGHTHGGAVPVPAAQGQASSADITQVKSEKVLLD